jgi:hypothetical protein
VEDDLEWKDAAGFIAPTQGYAGAHYATFSPKVLARFVKAMCPEKVCRICGEPSRRVVGDAEYFSDGKAVEHNKWASGIAKGLGAHSYKPDGNTTRVAPTVGWSDCECSTDGSHWRNGMILDPFAGSGTTLMVAHGHGRDSIGIDLDERNMELARGRLGMFLTEAG